MIRPFILILCEDDDDSDRTVPGHANFVDKKKRRRRRRRRTPEVGSSRDYVDWMNDGADGWV
jgi:rRNA processing protein Gar1